MDAVIRVENLTHTYSVGTPFEKTADARRERGVPPRGARRRHRPHRLGQEHLHAAPERPARAHERTRCTATGQDIFASKEATRDVRFKVGLVFQYPEYQLFEETVYKDIAFGPKNMKLCADGR